jgi:hypothetical protein
MLIRNFMMPFAKISKGYAFYINKAMFGDHSRLSKVHHTQPTTEYVTKDAERVFERFFKENPPKESERSFFSAQPHDKYEMLHFDPYKTLGLTKGADKQRVKEAYRELAMKYHPKNDSSVEAGERFIDVARAYEMLTSEEAERREGKKKPGHSGLAEEFMSTVQKCVDNEDSSAQKEVGGGKSRLRIAQLYHETTNVKRLGHKKEVKIEKEYNCGKNLIRLTRIEHFHEDGSVEITETYNDGTEVKTNSFVLESGSVEPTPIDTHIEWEKDHIFGKEKNAKTKAPIHSH